ncbi:hypothetical protein O7626_03280 [Micromonospora sp. WMMD1102]|uniref:trypco2 family protein n=1 Tax=Micromonospora sp. WMMD1102 TaxID=3016105 RepID=UPI0024158177|nr:trypco2 family protein [Micromonospora sp. WMMD1102]MDG4784964.1 hypothetical protein [Micromonospora sp. WMMD1102]
MTKIALADAVALVRQELLQAMATTDASGIQFPVGQITLNFQVGLTMSGTGSTGLKLWVFELGAEGSYAREAIQQVTIVLDPPVIGDHEGIKIGSIAADLPG